MEPVTGKKYRFTHKRKGQFVGQLTAKVMGDASDLILWKVLIDTSRGSGQERLANAMTRDENGVKGLPRWTEKLIRPQLVTKTEEV